MDENKNYLCIELENLTIEQLNLIVDTVNKLRLECGIEFMSVTASYEGKVSNKLW